MHGDSGPATTGARAALRSPARAGAGARGRASIVSAGILYTDTIRAYIAVPYIHGTYM
jgi:hypothetical protein